MNRDLDKAAEQNKENFEPLESRKKRREILRLG